jgi:putative ABC transport system permease protein
MIITTRVRKIGRDMTSRKFRTLMVAMSIFVGVLGVIVLSTVSDLLVGKLEADIHQDKLAMINVSVTVSHEAEVDNAAVLATLNGENNSLPALEGVTAADGLALYPVDFKHSGDDTFEEGFLKAYTSSLPDVQLEPLQLLEGKWPQPGEVTVEKRMADAHDFSVGDTIIFRGPSAGGIREVEYTISGLVYQPYFDNASSSDTSVYAEYADAQAILGFNGCNYLRFRYETYDQADKNFQPVQQTIAEQTPYVPVFATIQNPADNPMVQQMADTANVLTMLAVVAMIVSGFLVVNVIQAVVVEQKRQIGVMKSLGGTRFDNFYIYAGLALMYGILGTLPALILGIPLGYELTRMLGTEFDILIQDFDWSPISVLIGCLMGLAIPFLAAVLPVWNGTRVSILNAMTDFGIGNNYGRGRLERWAARLPLPITARQAFSNVVQKRGRLAMTAITLTLASAAFMGVLAVTVSAITEVDAIFSRMRYQVVVVPNQTQDQARIEKLIMEVDGVAHVSPTTYVSSEVQGNYTNFFTRNAQVETLGVDTSANVFDFSFKSGGDWNGDASREGVVIASPMARQLGVEAGDKITLVISGKSVTVPILGVDQAAFDFIYMEWQQLARIAGFVQNTDGTDNSEPKAVPNAYLVVLDQQDPTADEVEVIADALDAHLMGAGVTGTFQNQVANNEEITTFIGVFRNIMLVAAVLIALVGAIGLLTTLSMAVFERQREIGVMRSIGAGSRSIAGQFLNEGLLVGLLAWAIGIPLSYLLALALNSAMGLETIDFRYRLNIPVIGLVSMLAVTIISSLGPSLGATRKTVSDILRYQ